MSVDHYENFPVASFLCPARLRPAVKAIYHFARTADDLADEGVLDPAQRLDALRSYRAELLAVYADVPPGARWQSVFDALAVTRLQHQIPLDPLLALLDAFEQDVRNPSYSTRQELLDYCRLSANPVGRLLLHLYGVCDPRSLAQSDAICSALQLTNFWQDLSVDLPRGRSYLPTHDLQRHALTGDVLSAGKDTAASRALVRELVQWTRDLMLSGAPLARRLPGRIGWELRLVVQGGLRILAKIERMQFASLSRRPTLGKADAPALLWNALTWRGTGS